MAYSINIRSDDDSSKEIRFLWDKFEQLESEPSMKSMNYPPHFTLAVYEHLNVSTLIESFDKAFEASTKLKVRFGAYGYFETPHSIVLWAKPETSGDLIDLHSKFHTHINVQECRPNYCPSSWVPHCSLAISIDRNRREEVLTLVGRRFEPFEVIFDVVDIASFMPVEVLHEKALPSFS